MKQVAGTLRLELRNTVKWRRCAVWFGSDQATQRQLNRGARLVELLKQDQYQPLSVEKQVLIIYAGTNGFVDDLPLNALKKYEQELYLFVDAKHPDVFADILKKRELDNDLRAS